jgi:hypothetical protein
MLFYLGKDYIPSAGWVWRNVSLLLKGYSFNGSAIRFSGVISRLLVEWDISICEQY